MLKFLGIAAVVLVVAVGAVVVFAATRPDTFRIERSATIQAPPEKIFPFVNDLHNHMAWSPFEKKDPAMKRTYGGAQSGTGARYAWDGNKQIGAGSMEITESVPSSKVVMKLDFLRPFEAHNVGEFLLQPAGDGTRVTWAMSGSSPLVAKVMGLFFSMDAMVGKEFEAGLASLKSVAEKG